MGFKKIMDRKMLDTYFILVGMYDYLASNMPKFAEYFPLTNAEKENWFAASKHITSITESITGRMDTKFLQSIIPTMKNLEVFALSKMDASRKKKEYMDQQKVEISYTGYNELLEVVFELKCKGCELCNWKRCQQRVMFEKLGVPAIDERRKGFCPYKY